MFLDEEIALMIIVADPKDEAAEVKAIRKAIEMCNDRLNKDLKDCKTHQEIRSAYNKSFNIWDSACKVLVKEGFPFLKEGGLKKVYFNHPKLSEVLKSLSIKQ